MLETGEMKKEHVMGVKLLTTETIGGKVNLKNDVSASSVATAPLTETASMQNLLKAVPNFAAQQQKLSIQEPVIKNNPVLGEYKLNDDLDGLQHGTYLEASNREGHTKSRSVASRPAMKELASLINYKEATDFSGYGHLKNTTEVAKSVEVVYTLPAFEATSATDTQVVIDGSRVNEFDGLEYKDEKGNVIPGFDITYSYKGHEGEYSTLDTLKQRDDFSWDKVTALMVFGSLLPSSSYRIEFPFKIVNGLNGKQPIFNLNEYAFYDLTSNKHVNSRFNFRLSTPIFSKDDYQETPLMAIENNDDRYQVLDEDVQRLMPTLGEIPSAVNNFGESATITAESDEDQVLWQGGYYFFELGAVQNNIQEHGYSVNVDETGRKLMNANAFSISDDQVDFEKIDFIPYVIVHHLLETKDFILKAEAKEKWNHFDGVVKVSGLSAENEEVPVDPAQTFIVDDSELNDAQPGEYQVTIGYFLNGSEDENMLITSPANVKVVENKQTINVYYVDLGAVDNYDKASLQPTDGTILKDKTQTFTGKGDESYTNQLWGAEDGYEIFDHEQGAESGTYHGGEEPKDYYVYLIHKIEEVSEKHTVTRTITFKMPAGAKQTIKQVAVIKRTGTVDKANGKKTWNAWSKATLPAVTSPVVDGYTSKNIDAQPVTLTTKDSNLEVTYAPKKVSVKISFVDEEGTVIDTEMVDGLAGDPVDYSPTIEIDHLADKGYLIVDNGLPKDARFGEHKEYKIVLSKQGAKVQPVTVSYVDVPLDRLPIVKPASGKILEAQTQKIEVAEGEDYTNNLWDFEAAGYQLFKADKGALRGKYFAGSTEQQYYVYLTHKTSSLNDQHKVTRTINVVMPDGTKQSVIQEALATRAGVHDEVTGEDSWHNWRSGILPEYAPVKIPGYEVETVPAEKVDENATDIELTVNYVAQPAEVIIKFSDQFGKELATENFTGMTGDAIDYDPTSKIAELKNKGYTLVDNSFPTDNQFAAGKQTYVIKLNKLVAVQPHSQSTETSTEKQIETIKEKQPKEAATENKKGIFAAFKGLF